MCTRPKEVYQIALRVTGLEGELPEWWSASLLGLRRQCKTSFLLTLCSFASYYIIKAQKVTASWAGVSEFQRQCCSCPFPPFNPSDTKKIQTWRWVSPHCKTYSASSLCLAQKYRCQMKGRLEGRACRGEKSTLRKKKRPEIGKRKESNWGVEKREVAAKREVNQETPMKDNAAARPCSVLCKRKFSKCWENTGSLTHEEADHYGKLMERAIYSLLYYKPMCFIVCG